MSSEVTSESRSMPASKFTVKTLSRVVAKSESSAPASEEPHGRLYELTEELRHLEEKLRLGGGDESVPGKNGIWETS